MNGVEKIVGGKILEVYENSSSLSLLVEKDGKTYTVDIVADCETEYGGDCDEGNCFCKEELNVHLEEYKDKENGSPP